MSNNGSGRSHRRGTSPIELTKKFPDVDSTVKWFGSVFWTNGCTCPRCKGSKTYKIENESGMPYRCRDSKRYFSTKTGSILSSSMLPLQTWVWAVFLEMSSLDGVSSMKFHRDLGILQKTAWHLLHRVREGLLPEILQAYEGPIEVDESYLGGLEKNKLKDKKLHCR